MPEFVDLFRRYPNWDYSQANIEYLAAMGLPRPTYVPIGYVPELTRIDPAPEDIDVLFYGALNGRRYAVLRDLHDRGLRVKWLSGVYGASRDAWIARSKIVLNIHYWEAKIFEMAPVFPIYSPIDARWSPSMVPIRHWSADLQSGIAFADYDGLVDRCVELVGDERARRELAERGYQAFSARDQAAIVDRALWAGLENGCHETAVRDDPCIDVRLEGKDRSAADQLREHQLFTYNLFKHKAAQERDWLLAKVKRNPENVRSVSFLAETYFAVWRISSTRAGGVSGGSRSVAATRRPTGRCTGSRSRCRNLGEPWPDVEEAYLRAWKFRPTRAEALHAITFGVASSSATGSVTCLPSAPPKSHFPKRTSLSPDTPTSTLGAQPMSRRCAHPGSVSTPRRSRCAGACWPAPTSPSLIGNGSRPTATFGASHARGRLALPRSPGADPGRRSRSAEVTVSLIAGPDRETYEQTINSFLNCCLDVSRVGHFLVLDTGLSTPDRAKLRKRYGFLKFARRSCSSSRRPARAASRSDRRTVLAAPGRKLAVFRPRTTSPA